MRPLIWCRLVVRWQGGTLAACALLHALLVGWVGWYLVEVEWGRAPISASLTPLPSVTFTGAWIAGTLFLLSVGPWIGLRAIRGSWIGPDPTVILPVGRAIRVCSSWLASVVSLGVVGSTPLPIYFSLYELGAMTASEIAWAALAQTASMLFAPLVGIGATLLRRGG